MKVTETGEAIVVGGVDALETIREWQKVPTVSVTLGGHDIACVCLEKGTPGECFMPFETCGLISFNGASIPIVIAGTAVIHA